MARININYEGMSNKFKLVILSQLLGFCDSGKKFKLLVHAYHSKPYRNYLSIINVIAILCIAVWLHFSNFAFAQSDCNGQVTVDKIFNPISVLTGDPVTVYVHVHGCTGEIVTPIPFDAVLVIDQSGSMGTNDPNDKRIEAAQDFVNCAPVGSTIALVSFDDDAHIRVPMTTDKTAVINGLDDLRGNEGGGTNTYDALVKAHTLLVPSNREKFVVELTDGLDTSGHPDSDFDALLAEAVAMGYRYITIALGSEPNTWMLRSFANETGGHFAPSPTANDLAQAFDDACSYAGSLANTREIILKEKINHGSATSPSVQPVQGTFETDIDSITPEQINDFYLTGEIDAEIGSLSSGEGRFIKFDISSDCVDPDSQDDIVQVDIDDASSKIDYVYGTSSASVPLPMKQFTCHRSTEPRITKWFNESNFELRIDVESRYQTDPQGNVDNTIRQLVVIDQPSSYFQPDLTTLIPNTDVDVFPGPTADVIYWRLGDLAPQETKSVTVNLDSRVCDGNYVPPIPVNATKYTGGFPGMVNYLRPELTTGSQLMPFLSTNLLPPIPNCPGRPDFYLEPAQTYVEFRYGTGFVNRGVMKKDDSKAVWVDTKQSNGYWNRTLADAAAISGAQASQCGPSQSVEDCFRVDGQGDIWEISGFAPRVFARLANTGKQTSLNLPDGARLYVFNYQATGWDIIDNAHMSSMDPNQRKLLIFNVPTNSINPSAHIRTYKMRPMAAIKALEEINIGLWNQLRQVLELNPNLFAQLRQMGPSEPSDIIALLPQNIATVFENQLQSMGYSFAWGKPSIRIRIEVSTQGGVDVHSNNNYTEEVILVR